MGKLIHSILLVLLFASSGWATDYYISAAGSGTTCSSGVPCDLSYAITQATSGDTIFFKSDDTWTSATTPVLEAGAGVTYDGSTYGSGTRATLTTTIATAPNYSIVNMGKSGTTLKGFEINGNAKRVHMIAVGGYTQAGDITGNTIDNCVVHNTAGEVGDWFYGIIVTSRNTPGYKISNTTIKNTEVYDTFHEGIAIYASWNFYDSQVDGVLVQNCTIHDTGNDVLGAGAGIAINNNSKNVTVEHCNLYANTAHGLGIRTSPPDEGAVNILAGPTDMIVRYNIFRENWVHGIKFEAERTHPLTGSFYGNIFINNGTTENLDYYSNDIAIVEGTDYTYDGSVLNFYNNTFYNTTAPAANVKRSSIWASSGISMGNPTINLKNNIFYMGDYPAIIDRNGILTGTHSNNLIYMVNGDSYVAVNAIAAAAPAISATSVTVSNDATYSYFTKAAGGADWSTIFENTDVIQWSGFTSPYLGNKLLVIAATADQLKVAYRVQKGYYENTVTGAVNGSPAISATTVGLYNLAGSTYFVRGANDATDWTTLAGVGDTITWSGWSNSYYNGTAFTITAVAPSYIAVAALYDEFTETATVTATKAERTNYKLTTPPLITTWEASALTANPLLVNPTTNLRLQGASPAKAAGVNLGTGFTDFDSVPLPTPYGWPIGAYGYNSFGGSTGGFSGSIQ